MLNGISLLILILLLYGRRLARVNPYLHSAWMTVVIFADLTLVGFLAYNRQALEQVNTDMSGLLMVHLPLATGTVILYIAALVVGVQLLAGKRSFLKYMRLIDRVVVPLRILTFVTSVMLQVFATT